MDTALFQICLIVDRSIVHNVSSDVDTIILPPEYFASNALVWVVNFCGVASSFASKFQNSSNFNGISIVKL